MGLKLTNLATSNDAGYADMLPDVHSEWTAEDVLSLRRIAVCSMCLKSPDSSFATTMVKRGRSSGIVGNDEHFRGWSKSCFK